MKKTGMSLSLGCDGSSTNDSSSLLDSLRMAYLIQSFHSKERGGSPSSYEMLKMATVDKKSRKYMYQSNKESEF